MKKHLLVFSICLLPSYFLHAQQAPVSTVDPKKFCGTTEATQNLFIEHPELKQIVQQIEQEQEKNSSVLPIQQSTMVIPIVFHVLHQWGPENISDAQIKDAVVKMSEDWQKQNADTSQIVATFKPIAASLNIQFKLAQLDPSGNCTNGIDRIVTPLTNDGSNASKINQWDPHKYLNIWTVANIINPSGAAAYAYLPSGAAASPSLDGVVSIHSYVGRIGTSNSTNAFVLSHETGHWANLNHVWGNSNNPGVACGDDGVSDTPITMGWTTCNLTSNDVCTPGTEENVQNFMEYSYCSHMFTQGQATRVAQAMNSSVAYRNNIWSAANMTATGVNNTPTLCAADFSVGKTEVCVGTPITFTDNSWNATPTSWQWDFDNNTTIDATTQNPTYTYNTPGVYSVKLTVSDGVSTKSITKTSLILVLGNTATVWPNYYEGFENTGYPYTDCYTNMVVGPGLSWNRTTSAAATGIASLTINNYASTSRYIEEAIFPSMDFTFAQSPKLKFKVAYAQKSSTDADQMRVLISTNCGNNWIQKYSRSGSTLTSAGIVSGSFIPTSSQWRQDSVTISGYTGQSDFRFKFEFTGNGGTGNNIYLDDINVTVGNTGVQEEFANGFDLNVYPNPFSENTTVSFNLAEKHNVSVGIFDIVGKGVIGLSSPSELNAGPYSFPLNKKTLTSGVYFIKLNVDGYSVTKKIIIQ